MLTPQMPRPLTRNGSLAHWELLLTLTLMFLMLGFFASQPLR